MGASGVEDGDPEKGLGLSAARAIGALAFGSPPPALIRMVLGGRVAPRVGNVAPDGIGAALDANT